MIDESGAWTRARLRAFVEGVLPGRQVVIVSNREPYVHLYREENGGVRWVVPAGGLVTALDPVMRVTGGTWVAHGSGEADFEVADAEGRVPVPPDDPSYTLKRIALSREEEDGYYYGFANSALWPLCHQAFVRPQFRRGDWESYRAVNERFAEAIAAELTGERPVVFIQDYHFALLPRMLKARRPDAVVGQFWHIPWPHREAFRVCPWSTELLDGLLGNDLLGFQTPQHAVNFLNTADRELESRMDPAAQTVTRRGKTTYVRAYPISVDPAVLTASAAPEALAARSAALRQRYGVAGGRVGIGVDRVDYTKGIPDKLRALDVFFARYPQWRERFTFVQVGAVSRTRLAQYRALGEEIEQLVDELTWKYQRGRWRPVVYLPGLYDHRDLAAFYRMGDVCFVASLHDGMNLVAKEYVAARPDDSGALLLSEFAGAARELGDAYIVNPYDAEGCAEALRAALEAPPEENARRMARMRDTVQTHTVYRWAAAILGDLARFK